MGLFWGAAESLRKVDFFQTCISFLGSISLQVSDGDLAMAIADHDASSLFFRSLPRREKEIVILMDYMYPMPANGPEEILDVNPGRKTCNEDSLGLNACSL